MQTSKAAGADIYPVNFLVQSVCNVRAYVWIKKVVVLSIHSEQVGKIFLLHHGDLFKVL